ncbi:short-chain dehydrogenase/reductase SDR [Mycolicibacterium aurum]|uniref:Short-chain dehydrogenase/reductase SDR n=1 Tax=Mycolicibacterium aurum TaxID=1791 RepID=A0A3S4TY77_MYCAU|nr:SDR family oxidoreductase [Mycolicibacterium aurum]VEG55769.1 short-chain dehydrogenase/reductase SDR [Mycolicibacterium aurum]
MKFNNVTALVTGASGGIGEEFAVQLAQRGANLILVARRADKLTALRETLLARHPGIVVDVLAADLAVPGSGAELQSGIRELGRTVDVLVNNAGVGLHGKFVTQEPEGNAAQIQLNCGTLVDLTARFLPGMVERSTGVVINVASTAAFQPTPGMAVYGATKAFVLSYSEALWQECRGTGVTILALCPGATETEFFERTGEKFLTDGRQTSKQVVDTAFGALGNSSPTVVSGLRNSLLAAGYRFTPRKVMLAVSERILKSDD